MNPQVARQRGLVSASGLLLVTLVGCSQKVTRFDVVDYAASGEAERYAQTFDECYFCSDALGNIDIVARVWTANDDGVPTTQVVHMRTFWTPRPGTTRAERSMINATVGYLIVGGTSGATFEGSGFLTFRRNRKGDRITGELERSLLTPQRRLGEADRLFERAELSGTFAATRNKARVVEVTHDMRRRFGPMPDYDPASRIPDVR